ncbi:hypothetical protein DL93DRAFT_2158864 [Clavulina sp. PMI_390]|nr:hypothetical protein DL93DRAFT_2158864 [Clavulina sp. PMI_390]
MPDSDKTTDKAVDRMDKVSTQIPEAMPSTLSAPPEQFFTLNTPAEIMNFDDFIPGSSETTVPNYIRVNEAKLCDDMPSLSGIQLGPTGRSVSRSYEATLAQLIPGIADERAGEKLTLKQERYKKAMDWLKAPADLSTDGDELTRMGLYQRKLALYNAAVEQKAKAFAEALDLISKDLNNDTKLKKQGEFSYWIKENGRRYDAVIQAAYMEFMTIGQKEQVEYWLAVVDNCSDMV